MNIRKFLVNNEDAFAIVFRFDYMWIRYASFIYFNEEKNEVVEVVLGWVGELRERPFQQNDKDSFFVVKDGEIKGTVLANIEEHNESLEGTGLYQRIQQHNSFNGNEFLLKSLVPSLSDEEITEQQLKTESVYDTIYLDLGAREVEHYIL